MGPVLNGLIKLQSVENRLRVEKAKLTRCRRNVIIQENRIIMPTDSPACCAERFLLIHLVGLAWLANQKVH